MSRVFHVYVLTNASRTLYIGVTSSLAQRIFQHRSGVMKGFTSRYAVTQLVYYEEHDRAWSAIAREKQLKGWTRAKKIALVESFNPHWEDLSSHLSS